MPGQPEFEKLLIDAYDKFRAAVEADYWEEQSRQKGNIEIWSRKLKSDFGCTDEYIQNLLETRIRKAG